MFCCLRRLALSLRDAGSVPEAIHLLEKYVETDVKPLAYFELHDWYCVACASNSGEKSLAALERGIKEHDPQCVVKRVRSVIYISVACLCECGS